MARYTITTTPQKICEGAPARRGRDEEEEWLTRSFVISTSIGEPAGTVLLERGTTGTDAPDMTAAARITFGDIAMTYECEPGIALWAKTASGTIVLDVLRGGER